MQNEIPANTIEISDLNVSRPAKGICPLHLISNDKITNQVKPVKNQVLINSINNRLVGHSTLFPFCLPPF